MRHCLCLVVLGLPTWIVATPLGEPPLAPMPREVRQQPAVVVVVLERTMVVEVTPTSITVQRQGDVARKYSFTPGYLALNEIGKLAVPPLFPHRVADLQVGDIVWLDIAKERGVEVCKGVGIDRRPGGKVPPGLDELPDIPKEDRWHNVKNAEQAWEEKGIPIPKRYLDKDGRYTGTNPPYPPVAPPPREVKPVKP